MVPKYPFIVTITSRIGPEASSKTVRYAKSFETAAAAMTYAMTVRDTARVRRVEVSMYLDDWHRNDMNEEAIHAIA